MSPTDPMTSTRDRILIYLRENPTATVTGLSRSWGLTRADIRYHMNELIKEGLVENVPRDPKAAISRGRPVFQYRLAVSQKPGNYPQLCAALLDQCIAPLPETEQAEALKKLAAFLSTGYQTLPSPTQRYTKAVAFLNQSGYHARWEASAHGPRFMLRICPYAAILAGHPLLCLLDRFLLESLLQTRLHHAVMMDPNTGRPPACIFISA
jgi:predicted ArsR family transcriptional regulator